MDMKTLRVEALRRVIGQLSQKDFADQHDLDASYLSQILNGHRGLGEKAALNLEQKIGLAPGVLVNPGGYGSNVIEGEFQRHEVHREQSPAYQAMLGTASPRAIAIIDKLARAAAKGKLKESDLVLLEGIAGLLEKSNSEKP
jgi:transcriptional regulator with XRE-family HTH domain